MNNTALILPCGGMRNAYLSGVLEGLNITPDIFDAIFASSSAALAAAFFIAQQNSATRTIWTHNLTSPEVFTYRRMLKGKRPADVHYLVDVACRNLKKDAVIHSTTKLFVGVFDVKKGITEYIRVTDDNFSDIMKATCAFPVASHPIYYNDTVYADGGIEAILPVQEVYRQGYSKQMIINSVCPQKGVSTYGPVRQLIAFPTSAPARKALKQRLIHYETAMAFIQSPPAGVTTHMISASKPLPAHRFSRRPDEVHATYTTGCLDGIQHREETYLFLYGSKHKNKSFIRTSSLPH